jgi:pimeloyl-ACP methyl ester carboxylesterase
MSYVEPITARYVHIELGGVSYRTFFEEAGSGIPLVCLHTAGADAVEYRHLLNDAEITSRFRVLAFDMPWHGRSLPPDGWWQTEYKLTRRFYIDFIAAFCTALGLDRPALLGCSMGGYVLLDIAHETPTSYRALIAIQPRDYAPFWTQLSPLLDRPDLNYHSFTEIVRSASSPLAPEARRREVEWIYAKAGPGVLAGDLHYASEDHDARPFLKHIDTQAVGLFVVAGDWDFSCQPAHTERLQQQINGLQVTRIPEAGHFPPSEHPEAFRRALLPILEAVRMRRV